MRLFRSGALAATFFAFSLAPTLATGAIAPQVQQTGTTLDTPDAPTNGPNGKATTPMPTSSAMLVPLVPVTSPTPSSATSGCTPTTSLLQFDGGYEVSMCYRTPDTPDGTEGVEGQAKAGLYASAESGLLWFFSRDNAEVLVKVLNGCDINGYRWVFTAPVTTLEFDLQVTSPAGERWTHTNTQGVTAATKSDVAAFACADEPDAAAMNVSGVSVNSGSPGSPGSEENPVAGQNVASGSTVPSVPNNGGGGDSSAAAPNGRAGPASSASATSLRYHYSSASSPDEATDTSDAFMADDASDAAAAPTLAVGRHGRQTETIPDTPNTPNGKAPMPSAVPVPVTSPSTPGCTPTTSLLRFDGGYEVSMCYRTPDTPDGTEGVEGQAKAGLYASAESGLLWFFSRDNAEVLVKVLNGCAINGYRWVFVAPVTTLEFDLRVTSPTGARWNHTNTQGVTAATKSDVAAFSCADEPDTAPDLIVSDVTVSDAAPVVGQTIMLRAAVRNRGDGPASPATLRFYRSDDSTISASDNSDDLLASEAVAALAASGTESLTFDYTVPSTPGTFYLGACIDSVAAESRTGNNCSNGVRVVAKEEPDEPEAAPDLVVSDVTVSDATPVVGQTITLRATVRNRGDGPASPTTLRFYRSSDSTISASDNSDDLLASEAVPALAVSAAESRTFQFRIPSTPGTFHVGACIDSVSAESRTGNNCSNGVRVVAEEERDEEPDPEEPDPDPEDPEPEPDPAPDLTVSRFTLNDANPVPDSTFRAYATVLNAGDARSADTGVTLRRSDDPTISVEDPRFPDVDFSTVPPLAPSATQHASFLARTSTPETFYVGVCIPSFDDESDKSNNCSDGLLVTVEELGPGPDLIVSGFTVSDRNPPLGQDIVLTATIRNRGDSPATPTTLRFYRSEDPAIIVTEDTEVGSEAVAELAASATESLTFDYPVPSTPGTFYFGACIDSVSDESNAGNNCSSSSRGVVSVVADLIVSGFTVSDENLVVGDVVELQATVQNEGNYPATPTTLRYYRSDIWAISTERDEVGSDAVAALAASGTESLTFDYTVSSPAGTFWLGACVDSVSAEQGYFDTRNNCFTRGVRVVVREPAPDLIVPAVSVTDENPEPGAVVKLQATVENQGEVAASATTLRYYRSTNSTIDTGDTELGAAGVAALAASGTASLMFDVTVPSTAGTYYLGACIDDVADESDTGNNCSDGALVTVMGPDLTVSGAVTDANPVTDVTITFTATVENEGDGSATPTTLHYYQSDDSTINAEDEELGTAGVAELAALGTASLTYDFTTPSTAGAFYLGACIDDVTSESDTDNNCSDGVLVTVRERAPDLTVSGAVTDANPVTDVTITFTATVENEGDASATSTTLTYYRSDNAYISTGDDELGTAAVAELAASGTASLTYDYTVPSTPGTLYLGACVDDVDDESNTRNNCSTGALVTVRDRPDLTVSEFTVSDENPAAGEQITLSAVVLNQGAGAASQTMLQFYRSGNRTISRSDEELHNAVVAALAASGTESLTYDYTVPAAGTFYLGACVDRSSDETDDPNNCSDGALVTVE